MKLLLWILTATLALAGCSALPFTDEAQAREIARGLSQFYQTSAIIQTGQMEVRANIYRPDPMTTQVQVTAPPRLAGLEYTLRDGATQLSYQGLTFNLSPHGGAQVMPLVGAVNALADLLLPQAQRPLPTRTADGLWQLAGESGTLLLNDDGIPVKLLTQRQSTKIVLENFEFLG